MEDRPWIDAVCLEHDVDCLRGAWDEEQQVMMASFKTWNRRCVAIRRVVKILPFGDVRGIYIDGALRTVSSIVSSSEEAAVDLEVEEQEVDLVLLRA